MGDIFARSGRRAIHEGLPSVLRDERPDVVVMNGENAAGGNGITREILHELLSAGADAVTMGNHTWDQRDVLTFIDEEGRLVRPANYPPGTPGQGSVILSVGRERLLIMNLLGRVFSPSHLEDPFATADALLETYGSEAGAVLVDMHAETTSEKRALFYHLDGRVAAVVGTHTHVMTADLEISAAGTAFITDVGMTGPKDSVIGVKKELVVRKFLTQLPVRFEAATGGWQLNAVSITVEGGRAREAHVIRVCEETDR